MPTAIHKKSKRNLEVHVHKDGLARIALYVVGDKDWKRASRQIALPVDQAVETARRGECYIGMSDGKRPRSLMHSRGFRF